jgi:hypothetical protein
LETNKHSLKGYSPTKCNFGGTRDLGTFMSSGVIGAYSKPHGNETFSNIFKGNPKSTKHSATQNGG